MKTILIVEDDPFIADIYAQYFKREEFGVDVAKDGQMALEKIQNGIPDLLVLDINLPKINGWDLLKMIREDARTKDLKVIVVSNLGKEEFEEHADLNIIKFFLKAESSPNEIIQTIKEILK